MSRKIAILSTCAGCEAVYQGFLSETEQIQAILTVNRPNWHYTRYRLYENNLPDIDDYDAFIFSGSPASINDDHDWVQACLTLIRDIYSTDKKMIGICFGHQAIAKALGGEVIYAPQGWSLGSVKIDFFVEHPWMLPARNSLSLYAVHNEQVLSVPEGAQILARASHCPIASFQIGSQVLTTQHHPEMTNPFLTHLIDYLSKELDASITAKAKASLNGKTDGEIFAKWMVNFIENMNKL